MTIRDIEQLLNAKVPSELIALKNQYLKLSMEDRTRMLDLTVFDAKTYMKQVEAIIGYLSTQVQSIDRVRVDSICYDRLQVLLSKYETKLYSIKTNTMGTIYAVLGSHPSPTNAGIGGYYWSAKNPSIGSMLYYSTPAMLSEMPSYMRKMLYKR